MKNGDKAGGKYEVAYGKFREEADEAAREAHEAKVCSRVTIVLCSAVFFVNLLNLIKVLSH